VLYTHSTASATTFVVMVQMAALVAFIPVARASTTPP
jgi:hypothetical protein